MEAINNSEAIIIEGQTALRTSSNSNSKNQQHPNQALTSDKVSQLIQAKLLREMKARAFNWLTQICFQIIQTQVVVHCPSEAAPCSSPQ